MATTFLSDAFADVNSALNTFATSFSTNIANEIAPIVMSGLVLSFILLGILAVRGMLDRPFTEVAVKMLKVSVIVSIALGTPLFQQYIIDVFLTMPDDLVASVANSSLSGGANIATGQAAAQAIEQLYDAGSAAAGQYFDMFSIGIMPGSDTNIMPIIYGLLVWLGTILCVVVGTLWLFISKIVLSLMLGVAPVFIVMLIWQPTQQYFFSWLNVVFNTVITSVFVIAVFAIFMAIFKVQLDAIQISEDTNNFAEAATYTFLGLVCMGVLLVIPQYVSQLTGAAAGAVGQAMLAISGKAGSAASSAAGGAAGAARSGFAGKAAVDAFKESKSGGNSNFQSARHARHEYNKSMSEMKQGYPDYFRKTKSRDNQGGGS